MVKDIFQITRKLKIEGQDYSYYSLSELQKQGFSLEKVPFSIRILLENALRNYDDFTVTKENIETLLHWDPKGSNREVPFKPARVLMQDFTGVPSVVDIASLRSEVIRKGGDGTKINPLIPVDLVIDHSVQVDFFGTNYSESKNVEREYERNSERYKLLKWGQKGMDNFTVVPPGMGICHQVNLEYLAQGVIQRNGWVFPDSLVGLDSHTPMVNGIGVLGWGVGGIEAEAAMLGQPVYFNCPQVVGLKLIGKIPEGCTATDMVLTITRLLRDLGVVGKFVEVFGEGLDHLTVTDRATISNMSPEFGCTVTYFPIDDQTLEYMRKTNRSEEHIELVRSYCKENILWRSGHETIEYSEIAELDLGSLKPTVSGPKRPQDKIFVEDLANKFQELLKNEFARQYIPVKERQEHRWLAEGGSQTEFTDNEEQKTPDLVPEQENKLRSVKIKHQNSEYHVSDGTIVIAAITSCTNTSNPAVMIGAGLVARKALARGLRTKSWVKTSLAPGSKVVTTYLNRSGLSEDLDALRFHTVGYGCTSCIGNSGPLPKHIADAVDENELVVASVLSGNRNFEARVHPQVKMNFLMSPMLVVAYALVGRVDIDLLHDSLGYDPNGIPVYLKDIWPTQEEINKTIKESMRVEDFKQVYDVIFDGEEQWKNLSTAEGSQYTWEDDSTYIKEVPFFKDLPETPEDPEDIKNARVLLLLGDSVTTDHISPAGAFGENSAAGKYLKSKGVPLKDFNSFGSRRGNHEVMMRGTFANVRINNKITDKEGGYSTYFPTKETLTVYDAAMKYAEDDTPLIVIAGKEYGSGSSRDWAAKGTNLLGIKVVLVETFERIHRSNLVQMGVLPLEFINGDTATSLGIKGDENFCFTGIAQALYPGKIIKVIAEKANGEKIEFEAKSRLDSEIEIAYYTNGGILQYILRQFLKKNH